jgi:hypothetical protein
LLRFGLLYFLSNNVRKVHSRNPRVNHPTPRIQNFNNYKTNKVFAELLPSEGFSLRYDPSGEFMAIGCYNGTKLLYST